jgi:ankyrin repeat protein
VTDPLRVFVLDLGYHSDRVEGLVRAHEARVPGALEQVRTWLPEHGGAPLTLDAARLIHARQHGAPDWTAFAAHLRALAAGEREDLFLQAFQAMEAGAWDRVLALLRAHPDLCRARGTNGNTLLNLGISLAAASCAPLPPQADDILDALVRGGNVDQANDRGWTPLHQAAYGNAVPLVRRLLAAGARVDREAHGEGGTPLAVALFWGHGEVADVLAERAVVPSNLRIAAGLGRLDLVSRCFASDGALTADACRGRGFYRPHTGFPPWHPSEHRQEVLDEALVWAAKSDRVRVLPALVAHGADVNGDPYRGTPLGWAAANGNVATVTWLLDHGADIDRPGTFGGPSHGERVTALHLAAQNDRVEVVRLLLDRGADRGLEDALYQGTAAGWAEHGGATHVLELLAEREG